MRIFFRSKDQNQKNSNTSYQNTNNISKIIKKPNRYFLFMKLSFIIITIPIISYCSFYAWRYYKKTKRLIDDYLESYLNNLKNRISKLKEKLEKERIKNCDENINKELTVYDLFDLDICLEIIDLRNEINKRFINLNYSDLVMNKVNSISNESFDQYLCVYNEIRKKLKADQVFINSILEEKLNISIERILKKINKEKEFLLELNETIMHKDFFTRRKYEESNKFNLLEFLNIDIKSIFTNKTNKSKNENLLMIENQELNKKPSNLLDDSLEEEEEESWNNSISKDLIVNYCSAFYSFANLITEKLLELINNNSIDLIDPININKDLRKLTKGLLDYAYETINENYRLDMKNVFHILLLNKFFHVNKIAHCYDELKSYLMKFNILLLEI